jgi:dephospho-CoA kinase
MSMEKVERIINSQIEPAVRRENTDVTINNTGKISDLRIRIKEFVKELTGFPFKKVGKITEIEN